MFAFDVVLCSCLCRLSGVVYVADRAAGFGLAAQEPWIQHASVRDNILFGKAHDPAFYQAVIEACALSDDLNVRSLHFFTSVSLPAFVFLTFSVSTYHCVRSFGF